MRKVLLLNLAGVFVFFMIGSWALAQESAESEFTLEEITVTAEKRSETLQKIPSSVVAFEGSELAQQGKLTTRQMLESVPNVKWEGGFANVGVTDSAPDAGISIRGVRYKQTSDGQPPAATATYVDGVFQGYGGNFDVDRIEVLRGPQGTLYGRSATAGVVNFITKNPKLSEFGGDISIEVGEASLKNVQAAVNAPIGDKFAIRAAGHFLEKDGYYNADGAYSGVREGRIKALFQPTEAFEIMLSATINEQKTNSGGYAARLTSADTIDFKDTEEDVVEGVWRRGTQYSLTADYDFGESVLTYIGSYRHYEDTESEPEVVIRAGSQIMHNLFINYGEDFKTHELRLTSDWDEWWNWLVGVFYYNSDYDRYQASVNHIAYVDGVEDPDPNTRDAPIFEQPAIGEITNIGIFTEENFDLRDDMHLTLGLRYDKTKNDAFSAFNMNANENENRNACNPPDYIYLPYDDILEWNNITYKVRFEYDLTDSNMLYFLTATGFQPGDIRITNTFDENMQPYLYELPYDEEKLTSYEAGSKNRLLDNTLQLNVSAFYYDYEGYRHTVNTALSGPPVYAIITTPLRMVGAEVETEWLVTALDKVSFNIAFLDAEITDLPDIEELLYPTEHYVAETDVAGVPPFSATLAYDHVFSLVSGSTFVPRAEIRYTSGMNVNTEPMTEDQMDAGLEPYAHQDGYFIADIGATWSSASEKYSATGYVRNLFDKEYKSTVQFSGGVEAVGVNAGDPRVWGLMFSVKF